MIDFEQIKTDHHIIDVLDRLGVGLDAHNAGRSDFMVRCPIPNHDDARPSCMVHTDTDRFHCFGCGAHGDVIDLTQAVLGIRSPADAAAYLTHRNPTPVTSPVNSRGPSVAADPHRPVAGRTSLAEVLEINASAWREVTSRAHLDTAHRYLVSRGVDVRELARSEGRPLVGYTFAQPDGLTQRLRQAGHSDEALIDSGWAVHREDTLRDRFRRRVLFPFRDAQDRIVGATARDVTDQARCKYLNTPGTVAFRKGSVLYAATRRPSAVDLTVLCEGPIDALALAAAAAHRERRITALSTCGTALTTQQTELIASSSGDSKVIVVPDGDAAGRAAGGEWVRQLSLAGVRARLLELPPGHDPSSWVVESRRLNGCDSRNYLGPDM